MRRLIPVVLLLLLAQSALAQERPVVDRFYIDPPIVYEGDPFDIIVGGYFPGVEPPIRVTRVLNTINVDLPTTPGGPLILVPYGERIRIDGLPAGAHSIALHGLATERLLSFQVHEKPFTLSARVGEPGDEIAIEGLHIRDCEGEACRALAVFFGDSLGQPARIAYYDEFGRPVVVGPVPPGTGLVDVAVQLPTGEKPVLRQAFRYGRGVESDYERVLFPITFAGRGAHESEWRTDIVIRNDSGVRVRTELMPIAPRARITFPNTSRDGGAFLHMPRGGEKLLTYASHAVDLSRTSSDRGSEVPVVRADDTAPEIRLPDIPMRSLFRSHLRIYDFDDVRQESLEIVFRKEDGTEHVMHVQLPPTPVCVTPPCLPDRPSFAGVDLSAIRELENAGDVDITIRAGTNDRRIWAFVSVANNETQRVTLYTPQHKTPEGAIR